MSDRRVRAKVKRADFVELDSDDEVLEENQGRKRSGRIEEKRKVVDDAEERRPRRSVIRKKYSEPDEEDIDEMELDTAPRSRGARGRGQVAGSAEDEDEDMEDEDEEDEEDVSSDDGKADYSGIRNKRAKASSHKLTAADIAEATRTGLQSLSEYREQMRPFITEGAFSILEKAAENAPKHLAKAIASSSSEGEPSVELDVPRIPQPAGLASTVTLREYQLLGVSWLVNQYNRGINSILADEMGLGKTLQSIAFLSHLIQTEKKPGPHLVVVPLSVLFNWITEFRKFCPTIKVIRLHATDKNEQNRMKGVIADASLTQVVVTTYDLVKAGGLMQALRKICWNTIILDEGHRIKNDEAQVTLAAKNLKARFKLILTGTPVQNNLHESYVLLSFLFPSVFTDSRAFDEAFDLTGNQEVVNAKGKLVKGKKDLKVDRNTLNLAHYLMRPFILRRLKTEVEDKLPPKLETKITCPMSKMQKFWMQRLLLKERGALLKLEDGSDNPEKKDDGEWRKLQSIMTQLRKAAIHPYLFEGVETVSEDGQPTEEIVTSSGKMVMLDKLLKKLREHGHRVVLFSQYTRVLDILGDYLDWRGYKHHRLDGQTNRVMREVLINQFNKPGSDSFIFCLSTRAGGEGVNLFTADTVILFDSDWNPQVDIQAMARVHRIGQTKVVHVYRLVTAGSVEERIVQRAQKKLFLDGMVNRGSTAQSRAIDEDAGQEASGGDADANAEPEAGSVLGALKFGWNAVFKGDGDGSGDQGLSDEDIELIIDRTRGLPGGDGAGDEKAARLKQLFENQEVSLNDFDETAPLVSVREMEGEALLNEETSTVDGIADVWRQINPDPEPSASEGRSKRVRVSRLVEVEVDGVGTMAVLKKNNYSMNDGEPSINSRELASSNAQRAKAREAAIASSYQGRKGRQIAGRDFSHQEHCQMCWDGGELLLCGQCPAAYHLACLGLSAVPEATTWACPHHSCCKCGRKTSECGLLFRCEICPDAYCEDCMPVESSNILGTSTRFSELGYRNPPSCCFCVCSQRCQYFAENGTDPTEEEEEKVSSSSKKKGKGSKGSKEGKGAAAASARAPTGYAQELLLGIDADAAGSADGSSSSSSNASGLKRGASSMIKSNSLEALESCRLDDVKRRLGRAYDALDCHSRLPCLAAFPGFAKLLGETHPACKVVLKQIVDKVGDVLDLEGLGAETSAQSLPPLVAARLGDKVSDTDHAILTFAGVPSAASAAIQAQAFIEVVRLLSGLAKLPLIQLARLINIVHYSSVKKDKDADANDLAEPRFRTIQEATLGMRAKMEEGIASYLCTLLPQNLMVPFYSTHHKKKAVEVENADGTWSLVEPEAEEEKGENPAKTILITARLLESTMHRATDSNNIFYVGLSALNEGTRAISGWARSMGIVNTDAFNDSIAPARRLFVAYQNSGQDLSGLPSSLYDVLQSEASTYDEILALYESPIDAEAEELMALEKEEEEEEAAARKQNKVVATTGKRPRAQELDGGHELPGPKFSFTRPAELPHFKAEGAFRLFCETIMPTVEKRYRELGAEQRRAVFSAAWHTIDETTKQLFVSAYSAQVLRAQQAQVRKLEQQQHAAAEERGFHFYREEYLQKLRANADPGLDIFKDMHALEQLLSRSWHEDLSAERRDRFVQQGRESLLAAQQDCVTAAVGMERDFYTKPKAKPKLGPASAVGGAASAAGPARRRIVFSIPQMEMPLLQWHIEGKSDLEPRQELRREVLKKIAKVLLELPLDTWDSTSDFQAKLLQLELFLYMSAESADEYGDEAVIRRRISDVSAKTVA